MINYKKAGFNSLENLFDDMLSKQESGDHVGFIRLSSLLTSKQKVAFIDYSFGHKVFAGAMKDLVTESCGDYRVGKDYADYIRYALNKGGYIITTNPSDCCCVGDDWAYPRVNFTDGQLIEGYVDLFQKMVFLKAVDAKERIYNKSITYIDDADLISSIDHFKQDIEETFNETSVPEISMDSLLQDKEFMNSIGEAPVEKKAEADEVLLNDLYLYIINDYESYKKALAVIENLANKKIRGIYDDDLATKAWLYVVELGKSRYQQENKVNFKLSYNDKVSVANRIKEYYNDQLEYRVEEKLNKNINTEEEKNVEASAFSDIPESTMALARFLMVEPGEVHTDDGQNFTVDNDVMTYKVSDTALDLANEGYQVAEYSYNGKLFYIYGR